jgi:hypothetical protein
MVCAYCGENEREFNIGKRQRKLIIVPWSIAIKPAAACALFSIQIAQNRFAKVFGPGRGEPILFQTP